MSIYLDYNATTPLRDEVKKEMLDIMGPPLNASSVHSFGRQAKTHLENARTSISNFVNANSDQIIFTSGGTEANSMIMQIFKRPLISSIEHDAVIASSKNPNFIDVKKGAFELIYTGILSIGLGFTLQTIAQKHLPPTNVAILLSMESVFASIAAFIILGQILETNSLIGCTLILLGVIISEYFKNNNV